jgi:hypothetical protein
MCDALTKALIVAAGLCSAELAGDGCPPTYADVPEFMFWLDVVLTTWRGQPAKAYEKCYAAVVNSPTEYPEAVVVTACVNTANLFRANLCQHTPSPRELFDIATRPIVATEHPTASFDELSHLVEERWSALLEEDIKMFHEQSAQLLAKCAAYQGQRAASDVPDMSTV